MQAKNFLLLFLLYPIFLGAQTSTIRGVILDKQSETPLIGATVQLIAPESAAANGGVTDVNGRFAIRNVAVGRQALRISYLGYEAQTIPNIPPGQAKRCSWTSVWKSPLIKWPRWSFPPKRTKTNP